MLLPAPLESSLERSLAVSRPMETLDSFLQVILLLLLLQVHPPT